jgi:hypothetical protein
MTAAKNKIGEGKAGTAKNMKRYDQRPSQRREAVTSIPPRHNKRVTAKLVC